MNATDQLIKQKKVLIAKRNPWKVKIYRLREDIWI